MKRMLGWMACLVLLFGSVSHAARAELVVGADISLDSVTEFYYTMDASSNPPRYQRYHFFIADGKKLFEHETRQNGTWPQTEEDIVSNGTIELSQEQWAAFLDSLRGGSVKARAEETVSGNSGPWLYLYWSGDKGINQQFSFSSPAERAAFEEMCAKIAQNHILTRFSFSRGGNTMRRDYEMVLSKGRYMILVDEDESRQMDPALAEELLRIVEEYDLDSWNGFRATDSNARDGEDFTLELTYADGQSVYASGSNSFPDSYFQATGKIMDLFAREEMARVAGSYQYEGIGMGGDFAITLNADGTYTFYEGPLSSYLGGGNWYICYDTVYMTELNGLERTFMLNLDFDAQPGALVFLKQSDAFPYVKVAEGERFVRTEDDSRKPG